jgi:hypothetical protein
MPGIELATEQPVHQELGFCASHAGRPSCSIHALRSMDRARARCDIMVTDGRTDDIDDLAVRQTVDLAQHDRLTKRLRVEALRHIPVGSRLRAAAPQHHTHNFTQKKIALD